MLYEDITDESLRKKAIAEFLRINVRFLLKTPAPATTQPRAPIVLTKEEWAAVDERMREFHEHDR